MTSYANPDNSFRSESAGGPVRVVAPATGATITMASNERDLYVDVTATLAALTILLPREVSNGQKVEIGFNHIVTTLTIHDGAGNAISTAPTAATANSAIVLRYIKPPANLGLAAGWVIWT